MYRMADQVVTIGHHVTIQLNSSILSLAPACGAWCGAIFRISPHSPALVLYLS